MRPKQVSGILILLPVLTLASNAAQSNPAPKTSPHVDAGALCSFITQRMQSALPQVPTLCTPLTDSDYAVPLHMLSVSVFSPTDVLEGKMRRAWSTALFQTLRALFFGGALDGACAPSPPELASACIVRVSDSSMSNVYYEVFSENQTTYQLLKHFLGGDLASDDTYFAWWSSLMRGKTERHPEWMSKDNAESIAQEACKRFCDKIREYDSLFPKADLPVPGCAVTLATDSAVYVVLDFPNRFFASTLNYSMELPGTFGEAFDGSAYDGQIVFRSPWDETGKRSYVIYGLADIELAWEESQAGGSENEAKNEAKATVRLALRARGVGVQDRNDYGDVSGGGGGHQGCAYRWH